MLGQAKTFGRSMKVLLVDNDATSLLALTSALKAKASPDEFEILAAQSQDSALTSVSESYVDMVLISTNNIDELGRSLISAVRSLEGNRHTGIIILDQRPKDDSTLSVECLELGADDFIRHGCSPEEIVARVRAVLRLKAMTDQLRSANHKLTVLSNTDELTGLANMRSFNQKYGDMVRKCREGAEGLGVVMMDLDHFKSVNDSTNHLVGSYVLGEIGALIRKNDPMPGGAVARYGGDEFVFAWHCVSLDELIEKSEIVRKMVEHHVFEREGVSLRLSASLGAAFIAKGFEGRSEDLIKAADLMLYKSKNSGRNQVNGMILKYPVELDRERSDQLANRVQGSRRGSLSASLLTKIKA